MRAQQITKGAGTRRRDLASFHQIRHKLDHGVRWSPGEHLAEPCDRSVEPGSDGGVTHLEARGEILQRS